MDPDLLISRRSLLRLGGGCGLAAVSATSPALAKQALTGQPAGPRNVILLIADGMSLGTQTLALPFSRNVFQSETAWSQLLLDPAATHGLLDTQSANSLVTDSAAAASAWGSGAAVNNGSLNVSPNGASLTPITTVLKDRGYRTGLVTTDKLTGATPSGFAVNQHSRTDYFEIAPQFLDRVDVLLGGGRSHFVAGERPDKRDLLIEYRARGYKVVENRYELRRLGQVDRVVGLFADDTLPYTIDWLHSETMGHETPTLVDMTVAALTCLADRDEGFFLMVEGGRVDHAAHANDAAALLHEQVAFEAALGEAIAFADERDDTLVIATSDHGNANPGLNGFGPAYTKTDASFACLSNFRASFDTIRELVRDRARDASRADAARSVLDEMCSVAIEPMVAEVVGDALVGDDLPSELAVLQRNWVGVLSQILGNHTAIGFTGVNHTADRVLISAKGPGMDRFEGLRHHTDIHDFINRTLT